MEIIIINDFEVLIILFTLYIAKSRVGDQYDFKISCIGWYFYRLMTVERNSVKNVGTSENQKNISFNNSQICWQPSRSEKLLEWTKFKKKLLLKSIFCFHDDAYKD